MGSVSNWVGDIHIETRKDSIQIWSTEKDTITLGPEQAADLIGYLAGFLVWNLKEQQTAKEG